MVTVLPGVAFNVDKERGLVGFCDYLIVRSSQIFYVQGPIVAVVEAKKEDLIAGLGQGASPRWWPSGCTTNATGLRPVRYSVCVTSGSHWRFLKLEGATLFIDKPEYYLYDAGKVLGILVSIARG